MAARTEASSSITYTVSRLSQACVLLMRDHPGGESRDGHMKHGAAVCPSSRSVARSGPPLASAMGD